MSTSGSGCWCPDSAEVGGQLTGLECRSWISDRGEGRLVHETGRGTRAVVVSYAVTDDQVIFRFPEYNEICQYVLGRLVTLHVSGTCSNTRMRTEVVVTGVGHSGESEADLTGAVDLIEQWPSGMATHIICLDLDDIVGLARSPYSPDGDARRPGRPNRAVTGACDDEPWRPSPSVMPAA